MNGLQVEIRSDPAGLPPRGARGAGPSASRSRKYNPGTESRISDKVGDYSILFTGIVSVIAGDLVTDEIGRLNFYTYLLERIGLVQRQSRQKDKVNLSLEENQRADTK